MLLEPAGVTDRLDSGLLTLNRDLFSRISVVACKIRASISCGVHRILRTATRLFYNIENNRLILFNLLNP